MKRLPVILICVCALLAGGSAAGCGGENSPVAAQTVMDRALQPDTLQTAFPGGVEVRVESLGDGDRVLESRVVPVPGPVLERLRALKRDSTEELAGLAEDINWLGDGKIDGVKVDRIGGSLDAGALARVVTRAGASGAIRPDLSARSLRRSLVGARFELAAGREDGVMRGLDLTLSLDDPGTASPPVNVRFALSGSDLEAGE